MRNCTVASHPFPEKPLLHVTQYNVSSLSWQHAWMYCFFVNVCVTLSSRASKILQERNVVFLRGPRELRKVWLYRSSLSSPLCAMTSVPGAQSTWLTYKKKQLLNSITYLRMNLVVSWLTRFLEIVFFIKHDCCSTSHNLTVLSRDPLHSCVLSAVKVTQLTTSVSTISSRRNG